MVSKVKLLVIKMTNGWPMYYLALFANLVETLEPTTTYCKRRGSILDTYAQHSYRLQRYIGVACMRHADGMSGLCIQRAWGSGMPQNWHNPNPGVRCASCQHLLCMAET